MKHNFIINLSKYLLIFYPFFLISGPFLTDLSGSLIGIFIIFFIIKNKKFEYINNNYFYFFILIFICINLSSIFSFDQTISFKSSLTYLRLIFFIFAISYLINNYLELPIRIYSIYFFCLLILFIDSILIITLNFNIFGFQVDGSSPRIRSLFDDEEIMGSFVSRTLPLIIGLSYLFKNEKFTKYNFFMIMIAFFLILISGERTALANFFIFLFFFSFLEKKFFIRLMFSLSIVFLIIFYFKTESLKRAILHTIKQTEIGSNKLIIFSTRHTLHYHTAFEIFKDNPILGAGIKSFRKLCSKREYVETLEKKFKEQIKKNRLVDGCNTHPHHLYLQFLSEIGIVGFGLFLSLFLYITYNIFVLFRNLVFNFLPKEDKANYLFLVAVFITMFPFLPSGNYFNNWYIFINYLPMGFYLASKVKRKWKLK